MNILAQAVEGSTVLAGVVATVVGLLQLVVMFVLRWMRSFQVALQERVKDLEHAVSECHEERFALSTDVGVLKATLKQITGKD